MLNHIKQKESKINEETKKLDGYRSDRNKYQQNIQQIQALKGRIHMSTDKIKQMEIERTSIDNIKEACAKDIRVFLINTYLKNLLNLHIHIQ